MPETMQEKIARVKADASQAEIARRRRMTDAVAANKLAGDEQARNVAAWNTRHKEAAAAHRAAALGEASPTPAPAATPAAAAAPATKASTAKPAAAAAPAKPAGSGLRGQPKPKPVPLREYLSSSEYLALTPPQKRARLAELQAQANAERAAGGAR